MQIGEKIPPHAIPKTYTFAALFDKVQRVLCRKIESFANMSYSKNKRLCPSSLYPGFTFIADGEGRVYHLNGNYWRPRCKKNFKRQPNCHSSYLIVSAGRKSFLVSRIVCAAFHGAPKSGQQCHHLNGYIYDNRPDNLIWLSRKEHLLFDTVQRALRMAGRDLTKMSREKIISITRQYQLVNPQNLD